MRDDERRLRVGVVKPAEMRGDRRQAATAVDQDRHAPLGGEREHRLEALVVEQKALRPGMELDPACPEVECARRLLDRLLGEVEAHEGDDEPARALGGGERAVVGRAERRLAVGLVHAERESALHVPALQEADQLLVRGDHAVDVAADVDVRIEEDGAVRQELPGLLLVALDHAPCPLENRFHGSESTLSRYDPEPCPT